MREIIRNCLKDMNRVFDMKTISVTLSDFDDFERIGFPLNFSLDANGFNVGKVDFIEFEKENDEFGNEKVWLSLYRNDELLGMSFIDEFKHYEFYRINKILVVKIVNLERRLRPTLP